MDSTSVDDLVLLNSAHSRLDSTGWALARSEPGLSVHVGPVEGSRFRGVRATFEIGAELEDMEAFLWKDFERSTVVLDPAVVGLDVLWRDSSGDRLVALITSKVAWPFHDRDGVYYHVHRREAERLTIAFQSVDSVDGHVPRGRPRTVRVTQSPSCIRVTRLAPGRVRMELLEVCDPGGGIHWAVYNRLLVRMVASIFIGKGRRALAWARERERSRAA